MEKPKIDLKVLEQAWKREIPVGEEDIKSQNWEITVDIREIKITFKNDESHNSIIVTLKENGADYVSRVSACMAMASIKVGLKRRGIPFKPLGPENVVGIRPDYQYEIKQTKPVYQAVIDELKWLQGLFQICNEIQFLHIEISEQTSRKYWFSAR